LPKPNAAHRRVIGGEEAVRARLDDLRALLPDLPAWSERDADADRVVALLDLLERKQRQLIQDNVRLAGLRELTESLLREPDEERVLRMISLYLGHAYELAEVMVLSRTEDGGLRGYRARSGGRGLCEAVRWSAAMLKGSVWGQALSGEPVGDCVRDRQASGTPPPLPVILPLLAGAEDRGVHGASRADDDNPIIGLLALRPDDVTGAGSDPLEVRQVAFQAAMLLESVRNQRRAAREMRFRQCLFEAMGDGLLATDSGGTITAINQAALNLLGAETQSLTGASIETLRDCAPEIVAAVRAGLDGRMDLIPSEATIRWGREKIPVGLTVVGLGEEPGEGGGIVATLSDLRPIRAMAEEVRRLDRLAALGRFATAVAHEIRNPLAAIGAGIDYLAPAVPAERHDDLALMRSEIARLDRIVRDLLEPTQKRPLQKSRVTVASLIQTACKTNEPVARERAVRFSIQAPEDDLTHPVRVEVDVDRMLQVAVNIVRNACEASPKGEPVEIGWGIERTGASCDTRIWVQDRGPGIPADEIAHIFEPFYSTKSGGTGLGLYVSHGVVELHGGTLSAESGEGPGARITIRIPASLDPSGCESPHSATGRTDVGFDIDR